MTDTQLRHESGAARRPDVPRWRRPGAECRARCGLPGRWGDRGRAAGGRVRRPADGTGGEDR